MQVYFVYPETGEAAHLYNRLLDAPLDDLQDAIEKFILRWPDYRQIRSPNPEVNLATFLCDQTGEIVVIRHVQRSTGENAEQG